MLTSHINTTLFSSERTPIRRHVACLKPARFSLDKPGDPLPPEQSGKYYKYYLSFEF